MDIVFKSELEDTRENGFFSKVNIHVHFVQFDIQATDGVNTGFNYETSIRPFTSEGETLAASVDAGEESVDSATPDGFTQAFWWGWAWTRMKPWIRRILAIEMETLVDEPHQQRRHRSAQSTSGSPSGTT